MLDAMVWNDDDMGIATPIEEINLHPHIGRHVFMDVIRRIIQAVDR